MSKLRVWTVAIALTCTCRHDSTERIPGEGRVVAFERYRHWLSVFGGPRVMFPRLFRMDQLSHFAPGAPPYFTGITHGIPDTIRRGPGAEYFVYHTPQGVIEVGSESTADGGVGYPLYYYPTDRRPESFLPPEILRHIRRNAEKEVLMVFEFGVEQAGLQVHLRQGQIERIIWMSVTQLAPRRDQNQCTPWEVESR